MSNGKFILGALSLSMLFLVGCSGGEETSEKSSPEQTKEKVAGGETKTAKDTMDMVSDHFNNGPKKVVPAPEAAPDLNTVKEFPPTKPADRSEYVDLSFPTYLMLLYAHTGWTDHSFKAIANLHGYQNELNGLPDLAHKITYEQDAFARRDLQQKYDQQFEEEVSKYEGLRVKWTASTGGRLLKEYNFDKEGFAWNGDGLNAGNYHTSTNVYQSVYHFANINAAEFLFYSVPDVEKAKQLEKVRQTGMHGIVYGQIVRMIDKSDKSVSFPKYVFEIVPHHIDLIDNQTRKVVLSKSI